MLRGPLLALALSVAAGCTGENPDFGAACVRGGRSCLTTLSGLSVPIVCALDDSGAPTLRQERCPAPALCSGGACVASPGLRACGRQQDCESGEVCAPLLSPDSVARVVASYCLRADSAPKVAGAECASDEECQSYLCIQHSRGRYCLNACKVTADCKIPNQCRSFDVTVTGIRGTISSCSAS